MMLWGSVSQLGRDVKAALFLPSEERVLETHEHRGDFKEP
jgi:hypothetical protein